MHVNNSNEATQQAIQAFLLWLIFIIASITLNGTIPFIRGADLHAWAESATQTFLSGLIIYGVIFLVAPLVLVKGWQTVRQPGFLFLLLLAIIAAGFWEIYRGVGAIIVVILIYLHWRYDLSELGFRSSGWRGDALATLIIISLDMIPLLFRPLSGSLDLLGGIQAGLFRLLGNPATSAEYLFYFGFLATRLAKRIGPIITPILIGLMYTAHEMTNPEYWYEGMQFGFVLVGVTLFTVIFLWRRSLLPIWLGDGLARIIQKL